MQDGKLVELVVGVGGFGFRGALFEKLVFD
jgi:hypothetical protein